MISTMSVNQLLSKAFLGLQTHDSASSLKQILIALGCKPSSYQEFSNVLQISRIFTKRNN